MLSYQHAYHAGNLADVHKHAALAWALAYLTRKDKPLSYIETHAGRGLYDLTAEEARKKGEAAGGILRAEVAEWFDAHHPYAQALAKIRARHGGSAYPGSPLLASVLLRRSGTLHLAELHPRERDALAASLHRKAHIHDRDGYAMADAVCPPTPRRGFLLIDPSYERKSEYTTAAALLEKLHRKWPVGVLMLWYPILPAGLHEAPIDGLCKVMPDALRHEVRFQPLAEGHGLAGSGLFIVNPPFGLEDELTRLGTCFTRLTRFRDPS